MAATTEQSKFPVSVPVQDNAPPPYPHDDKPLSEISISLSANPNKKDVFITLTPPREPISLHKEQEAKRAPVDICCVLDVSGSMDDAAPAPGGDESNGLNILDVVKHAMRTIISTMTPDDRLSIVSFSSSGDVITNLTFMDDAGKASALKAIGELYPSGGTNLWDGLRLGMNVLNGIDNSESAELSKTAHTNVNDPHTAPSSSAETVPVEAPIAPDAVYERRSVSSLFILTDGCPNTTPPQGHIPTLQAYLDSHPQQRFGIHTFGFGYELDSALLLEIAKLGKGGFGFIPDSGMVGTVFIHAMANVYATYGTCTIDVEVEGVEDGVAEVFGGINAVKTSWGAQINVGDIQYGQTKDVIVRLKELSTGVSVTARYHPWTIAPSDKSLSTAAQLDNQGLAAERYSDALIKHHFNNYRLKLVSTIYDIETDNRDRTIRKVKKASKIIHRLPLNHADSLALADDLDGQVLLGLSSEHFKRWGRHYLPSLARSHQLQQCSNFKDPGLQVYGRDSPLFIKARDELDAAFDALPPPTPSLLHEVNGRVTVLSSMASYHTSAGPCFSGSCRITLADGSRIPLCELKRGMAVQTLVGKREVAVVVRTPVKGGIISLCTLGQLQITPWHPVISPAGEWAFPAYLTDPQATSCDAIYSILLRPDSNPAAHSVIIEGLTCVTLGHSIKHATKDVRSHGFFGDYEKVLESLGHLPGFFDDAGVVESGGVIRPSQGGEVTDFIPPQDDVIGLSAMQTVLASLVTVNQ